MSEAYDIAHQVDLGNVVYEWSLGIDALATINIGVTTGKYRSLAFSRIIYSALVTPEAQRLHR